MSLRSGPVPVGPVPVGLVPVGLVPVGPVPVGPVPVGPVLVVGPVPDLKSNLIEVTICSMRHRICH